MSLTLTVQQARELHEYRARLQRETIRELDLDSFSKRVALNVLDEFPKRSHPCLHKVFAFKITEDILKPLEIPTQRHMWYITDLATLDEMYEILLEKTVLAIDTELDNTYSYIPITTLIQISVDTHDFIIDAISCFPYIETKLKNILLDNKVLKIMFSANDMLAFKRDFNLFCTGVIDIQLLYKVFNGQQNYISLKDLVKLYLDKDLDKQYQTYPFRMKDLPTEVVEYARDDSKYLLKCWEVMKVKERENLFKRYPYKDSNVAMTKPYAFPKIKPMSKVFNEIRSSLKHRNGTVTDQYQDFTSEKYYNILSSVIFFRRNAAKFRDMPPGKVLKPSEVAWLCVTKPSNVKMLDSVLASISEWSLGEKEGLVEAINAGRSEGFKLPSKNNVRQIVFEYESEESDWEFDVYLAPGNINENENNENNERVCTPNLNTVEVDMEEEERVFNTQEQELPNDKDETMSQISVYDVNIHNEYAIENIANEISDPNANDCKKNLEKDSMNDSGMCDAVFETANDNENISRVVSDENESVCVTVENINVNVPTSENVNMDEIAEVHILPLRENRFDRISDFNMINSYDLMRNWKEIRQSRMGKPLINRLRRARATMLKQRREQLDLRVGAKNVDFPY
ncbi:unnamed protein product [Orchesella dallaii]|uniref:3'-5' exonuclease domain-containing protein n=1 Tax=Orchesella dallaii TaxID=48710 RepID=A0ABP1RR40_9HEXA